MRKLLIVNQDQFGYGTDSYQYCKHLSGRYDLTYLDWDYGNTEVTVEGVRVVHVSRRGGKIRRLGRFLRHALREMRENSYDGVFVAYFAGASLLRLFSPSRPMVLDIRTGDVTQNAALRGFKNSLMSLESLGYRHITIISDSVRRLLHINSGKCHILPLGAEDVEVADRTYSALRLFYVGSLDQRRIDDTVRGFARFIKDHGDSIDATYEIVGFGATDEEDRLRAAIRDSGCEEKISFVGRVPHAHLQPYLKRNNVGVVYVPVRSYYDRQPPTKLFEYLLAGMPVIATKTTENKAMVTAVNGVLIDDSPEGFYRGLVALAQRRTGFTTRTIKSTVRAFTWDRIVLENLDPYLQVLMRPPAERTP